VHAVCDVHETPLSATDNAPAGSGVRCSDHPLPSHRSANGPESEDPTAVQTLLDTHDTADRLPPGTDSPAGTP
jgi:hypothetical protein